VMMYGSTEAWYSFLGPQKQKRHFEDRIRRASVIFLSYEGRTSQGYGDTRWGAFRAGKSDIVIPYTVPVLPGLALWDPLDESLKPMSFTTWLQTKTVFVWFRGSPCTHRIRTSAQHVFRRSLSLGPVPRKSSAFVQSFHASHGADSLLQYHLSSRPCGDRTINETALRGTKQENRGALLCLHFPGLTASSLRFYECVAYGSIPVLISDRHAVPFDDLAPRCPFYLRWPERDLDRLPEFLYSLSREHIEDLFRCLVEARTRFGWDRGVLDAIKRALASQRVKTNEY